MRRASPRSGGFGRFWFALRTLAVRLRFLTGKASFVEADIKMTTNNVTEIVDAAVGARTQKLLSHYQLTTRKPRTGMQGWQLYEERLREPSPHRAVTLECAYCGHQFVIQILSSLDPLASESTGGRPPGLPASYTSDWFRFLPARQDGEQTLSCPRCEHAGAPSVRYLSPS